MTDKEQFLQQKKSEIEKILKQQARLAVKGTNLAKKNYKTDAAKMRNLIKVVLIAGQIKGLEAQKLMVMAQPFRKFPDGAIIPYGPAIVGESGKEIILNPNNLQP